MRTKLFTALVSTGLITTGTVTLALASFSSISFAAPPPKDTCTVSSIQLVGATPGAIDSDGYVTAGTPVTIKGLVSQANPATGSSCDAGTGGAAVTEGTLKIEGQRRDGLPSACKEAGVGSFATLQTQPVTGAAGSNVIERAFDSTGLDETRGYRTDYTKVGGGSFTSSKSVCVNLTINPSADPANPCDSYGDEVVLNIMAGAGKGIVGPGDVGPWSYTFEVLNCTGMDDLAVKVQGGTSGWTVFDNAFTAPVEPFTSTPKSKGKKGTTSTITWHTILNDEQSKTMTVVLDGVVPSGVVNGEWINLSGAWSAAYKDALGLAAKSEYTPQVYLEVVLP